MPIRSFYALFSIATGTLGTLVGLFSLCAAASPPDVIINEVMYAPQPHQNEYIELYNRSDEAVDISTLSYANGHREFVPIATEPFWLEGGGYLVIVRDPALFEARFPDVPYVAPGGFRALRNGGDAVIIRHGTTVVDEVAYAPSWGGTNDVSLERIDPAAPGQAAFNWASSTHPDGGTPGAANSVFAPDTVPPRPVFAQVDAERTRIDVTFDQPLNPASLSTATFNDEYPSSAVQLDAQTVRLFYNAAQHARELTVAGVSDWSGNSTTHTIPLSYVPHRGDLAINEIMYRPLQDDFDGRPNQPEYVELVNTTGRWISLQGLFKTNRPREWGEADTLQLDIGRQHVEPGAYAVIYAERHADDDGPTALEQSFPAQWSESAAPSVTLVAVPRSRLGLRVQDDRLRLHRADGRFVATVDYSPDWHAPGLQDSRGVALERISLTAPANDPTNWTSSAHPEGGTPGRTNSVGPPPATPIDTPLQASPSPFAPERDHATRIQYALSFQPDWVQLRIFDAHGRLVRTVDERVLAGTEGEVLWDGRSDDGHIVRMGIYIVLLEAQAWATGDTARHRTTVVLARPL